MEIRALKAKDVKTLAKMLGKLKESSIGDILVSIEKQANPMKVGLSLFHIVAADLTDDIYAWLADLIGKKPDDLDEMDFNAPAEIVKALVSRGDFKSFFDAGINQVKSNSSADSMTSSSPDTDGQTK